MNEILDRIVKLVMVLSGMAMTIEIASANIDTGIYYFTYIDNSGFSTVSKFQVDSYNDFKENHQSVLGNNLDVNIKINTGESVGWSDMSQYPMTIQIDNLSYSCTLKGNSDYNCHYKFNTEGNYDVYIKEYPNIKHQIITVGNPAQTVTSEPTITYTPQPTNIQPAYTPQPTYIQPTVNPTYKQPTYPPVVTPTPTPSVAKILPVVVTPAPTPVPPCQDDISLYGAGRCYGYVAGRVINGAVHGLWNAFF